MYRRNRPRLRAAAARQERVLPLAANAQPLWQNGPPQPLPQEQVQARALELASSFAPGPTLALSQIKRQFASAPTQSLDEALEFEATVQALMTWTEDFKEGTTAFKERRKPTYRGA